MKLMIAITTINLIVSGTTLTIVLVGAKRVQDQIDASKTKANQTLAKIREAALAMEDL